MKSIPKAIHREIPRALLAWYDQNRRILPWRALPGEKADPYRVWLSEIMLQQTNVATVLSYFPRFLERWPTLQDLARADLDQVLWQWQGLGYYSRARNLLACAQEICRNHDGRFPKAGLEQLPGIGSYTAAAIGAIAFGEPKAAIDANAERVISRLFRIPDKKALMAKANLLVPEDRSGDFAQALMDLGSMVCRSGLPQCDKCPLHSLCAGAKQGDAARFPIKSKIKKRRKLHAIAYWIEDDQGRIAFQRRPQQGLLAGLMETPMSEWREEKPTLAAAIEVAPLRAEWQKLPGSIEHIFTHLILETVILKASIKNGESYSYEWHRAPFRDLALSSLMRKVTKRMVRA